MAEGISQLISDPESELLRTRPVVIFAPAGKSRKRFPETCVQIFDDEMAARAAADPEHGYHAAVASGPSRSSEGFRLYYLLRWLD